MPFCPACKVSVSTETERCPLCRGPLERGAGSAEETYPRYAERADGAKVSRIISIASPAVIAASVALNVLVLRESYWSVIVSSAVVYSWLLGLLTFNRRVPVAIKLLAHGVSIPMLLTVVNMFATGGRMAGHVTWAISYAIPSVLLCLIITQNILMLRRSYKIRDYLLCQLGLCLMGLVPLAVALLMSMRPLYPSIAAAALSVATVAVMVLLLRKAMAAEFSRKFFV